MYLYIITFRMNIVLVLSPSDAVVKGELTPNPPNQLMKAFHTAYRTAVANPFLRLHAPADAVSDHANSPQVGGAKWKNSRRTVDDTAAFILERYLFLLPPYRRTDVQCPVRGFLCAQFTRLAFIRMQRWFLFRASRTCARVSSRQCTLRQNQSQQTHSD